MDCVVAAGGIPLPDDPLYVYTQGKPKALIDMCGRTMLERVIDALQTSHYVEDVLVVGLGSDSGMQFRRPVRHLPDQGNIVANVITGIKRLTEQKPETRAVLVSSADVPTLTGAVVDRFVELCQPFDKAVYYNFATKEAMESRFPRSNRTYIKLKGVEIAGGDVVLVHAELADRHHELWTAMTNARKHAWQLARIVGIRFMIKFLLRRLSIAEIEDTGQRIIDRPVKIILNPDAEVAMDADKPHQVDLLRNDIKRRQI